MFIASFVKLRWWMRWERSYAATAVRPPFQPCWRCWKKYRGRAPWSSRKDPWQGYAWANVSPELLRELWGVMEKIGGIVPPRPEMLLKGKGKPLVSEWFIQEVLEAIGVIVS